MTETQWEYIVQELGSVFRGVKPEEAEAIMNELGEAGWEIIHIRQPQSSNKLWITAKRPLTTRSRRRRSLPGERW
jgi:hypothetical protein